MSQMDELNVLAELARANAIVVDKHFVYASRKHGPNYINLDPLFPDATLVMRICERLIEPFSGEFETVAGPAIGGIVLSQFSAIAATNRGQPVFSVWADKAGDEFAFERAGFQRHLDGKRVLLVEDLVTTGGSLAKVQRCAAESGADVIGASVICNRGNVSAQQLGVSRLESLASVNFSSWEPHDCQLCRDGVPIVDDVAHGATFKAEHPGYAGGYASLLA